MEKRYKRGLILGKFYPFHLGHRYLIDSGLKKCDHLDIIICYNSGQNISGEDRFNAIIREYDRSNIDIHLLRDDHLPKSDLECKSKDEFYSLWVPEIYGLISKVDVVFTSEDYGDDFSRYLGCDHIMIDRERISYPISGSMIRSDSMSNWNYISNGMRKNYVKRVSVLGPESSGKTTLVQNLANYFNTNFVVEYGRMVADNNPDLSIDNFLEISIGRQELEDWLIPYSNRVIFCDTEDITTYTYSKMYCPGEYSKYELYFHDLISKNTYDLYILLDPYCDSIQDGTRRFLNDKINHFNRIKDNLEYFSKPYHLISGDWNNRYNVSKQLINKLIYNI